MTFYVGAYGMSPCTAQWNANLEAAYLDGLKTLPFMRGIELPHYASTLDRWNEDFFFARADPGWDYVVSTLPSLSQALRESPAFGLASTDEPSRQEALAGIRAANASVRRTHDRLGKAAIRAVEIHSGPSLGWIEGTGSPEQLTSSMLEISQWDWDGARIVVEHCDAAVPNQPHEKGFLRLEDEIRAIENANARGCGVGASINWGRSAIELRGSEKVPGHVRSLVDAGLLLGVMFSGCSGADTPFGAWKDTHMPPAKARYMSAWESESLLDENAMVATLEPVHHLEDVFFGVKIAARPIDTSVERRIEYLRSALMMLASARLQFRGRTAG